MITMSAESLDELERICRSNRNFRACIYCEDSLRALAIQNALLAAWDETNHERYFGGGLAVRFLGTNSVVRILERQDLRSMQLYSCHLAIVDCEACITEDLERMLNEITVQYDPRPASHCVEFDNDLEWTIYFENGSKIKSIPKVPDFGDIIPSAEILDFIGGLSG